MNTQKGFAPILLILLGIVIIGVGVYVYTQNNFEETIEDSQDFVMGGIWKFEEIFPTPSLNGATSPVWEYTLSIDMEDETKGTLHIDGYQTIARLNVRIEKLNDSANIILGSYGKDNQFETYKKGDLLITVSPDIDRNLMTIDWYKMQPNVEESKFNAIFVKTSTQIKKEEDMSDNILNNTHDISSWEIIDFDRWGISVKYPNSIMTIDREFSGADKVWFKYNKESINGQGITMSIEVKDISIEDFIKGYTSQDEFNKIESKTETVIDGAPATKLVVTSALGLSTTYLLIRENNTTYIVHYYDGNDQNLYHQTILSTFKFLN